MRPLSPSSAFCLFLSTISSLSRTASAASAQEWKTKSIYQIMIDRFALENGSTTAPCDLNNYCGGTWRATINNLDYVQGMGFDAIYISPMTEQMPQMTKEGEGYHGYWPQNIYEVNSHFGTAQDLKDLSQALHDRGMWLMMDVVINDMGYAIKTGDEESAVDYSVFVPFNSAEYFHTFCPVINYDNYTEAQDCWLGDDVVALADLYTEKPFVVDTMASWVKDLIANYSIDGLRIDAAKHVNNDFLINFANAANMYTVGEVYEPNTTLFCPYQSMVSGMTNYPNYFAMIQAFTAGNMSALTNQMAVTKAMCSDMTLLASFSENHDVPRFASYTQDIQLAKTAIAWTVLADGVPMIYQGQEQHFDGNGTPTNRAPLWTTGLTNSSELYSFVTLMNKMRKHAITVDPNYVDYVQQAIYDDGSVIALRKGFEGQQIIQVLSNSGSEQGQYTLSIPTAYSPGLLVMDVVTCQNTTINQYAQLEVPMGGGVPHVFFPANKMNGSFICGMGNWSVKVGNGKTGPARNAAVSQDGSLYSSSIAMIFAFVVAFCLL